MQRKFKFLTIIVTTALVAALVIASAGPAIGSWIDHSVVSITSGAATTGITTEVVGVATNAIINPIDIDGHTYSAPGGDGAYSITQFDSGAIASDPTSLISQVSISASGFVPGDYALFQVTVTNTGSTTLQFGDYTVLSEFVNSGGTSIAYTFPVVTDPTQPAGYQTMGGNTAPANPGFAYSGVISGFWNTNPTQSAQTALFLTYLNDEQVAGCANTWCGDNALIPGPAPTVGQTLANGGTFVYYIYIGLGIDTAPGIPNMLYTLDLPLTVAN